MVVWQHTHRKKSLSPHPEDTVDTNHTLFYIPHLAYRAKYKSCRHCLHFHPKLNGCLVALLCLNVLQTRLKLRNHPDLGNNNPLCFLFRLSK